MSTEEKREREIASEIAEILIDKIANYCWHSSDNAKECFAIHANQDILKLAEMYLDKESVEKLYELDTEIYADMCEWIAQELENLIIREEEEQEEEDNE